MKKIIISMVLLSALVLGGCGHHNEHATTSTQSSSKVHKKDTSSKSNSKESSSSSKQVTASNNQSSKKDNGPTKFIFPNRMQGTWYSYQKDQNDDYKICKLIIKDNVMRTVSYFGDYSCPSFDATTRSKHDLDILSKGGKFDSHKVNWGAAAYTLINSNTRFSKNENATKIINIRGWYQTAGDGEFYYVATENIDGKQVEVLTEAGGAGVWLDNHYYKTVDQAKMYAERTFKSDIIRD